VTEQADLITARVRNSAKRAQVHEMLETAAADRKAAVARIAAKSLPASATELERLDAVYENLLERERALKSSGSNNDAKKQESDTAQKSDRS
jgi:hypothetical protein